MLKSLLSAFTHIQMLLESNDEDIKHTSRGSHNHNNFFVIFVGIALKLEKIGFIHVRPRNP